MVKSKQKQSDEALVRLVEEVLADHKAGEIAVIDLEGKTAFADTMIVASGTSRRHLLTLAESLKEALKSHVAFVHIEAGHESDWVLVDCNTIIVHLFRPEARMLYDIERLWAVAPDLLKKRQKKS